MAVFVMTVDRLGVCSSAGEVAGSMRDDAPRLVMNTVSVFYGLLRCVQIFRRNGLSPAMCSVVDV